ncbi:DUF3102 domain-containing protein [Salmonella enterica subsp. enterica serovar Montevideo]|uniref:DUF3102 domain-containing protein n=7 Tax=Enterobacteriaceae TaxID=543 RepID=A0A608XBD3_SALMO|nr:DUF3102 domain-containing protein [Escherichia coli]EAA8471068.1 DUF3102 domain-containing protein [Salmonella enterica]EAU8724284.1 DUF3102 domain-containing protein [Salmonella enterica subsp. enterica serovar Montevideo]EBG9939741.1 DUF3102 domain-containing protein [Salmonella enterica subsp. enterica serovar Cerro]ECE1117332.1 DUF3102 domain-containing protein [Salmonella enterica subsp. enterica]EDD0351484.1 DUF3102 domain-containing protein [Salmonella enterica subsp. enterica serova
MGRTKSPMTTDLNAEVPLSDDLNVSLNTMTQHRMEIMQQFGDGLPYERNRIVHEARFYMDQSAEAMLEAGKRLVILKENEPHGEYVQIVKEQLNLEPRIAQKMAQAALKFLSPELTSKAKTFSHLGRSKLYELMLEDDEDLAELADGGTVAGLTLDDVDRMSVRELRQSLREARETNAAQQRVLADKNEKIDSLSTRLEKKSRIQPPEPDEEVKKLRAEVTALAVEAESAIAVRLSSAFETLCAYCAENMIDTPRDFMAGLVCQLESTARSLRSTFDLPDEPTGNAAPSWLTEPTPQINGLEA